MLLTLGSFVRFREARNRADAASVIPASSFRPIHPILPAALWSPTAAARSVSGTAAASRR